MVSKILVGQEAIPCRLHELSHISLQPFHQLTILHFLDKQLKTHLLPQLYDCARHVLVLVVAMLNGISVSGC